MELDPTCLVIAAAALLNAARIWYATRPLRTVRIAKTAPVARPVRVAPICVFVQ